MNSTCLLFVALVASLPHALEGGRIPTTQPGGTYRLTRQGVAGLASPEWVFVIVTPNGHPWVTTEAKIRWAIEQAVPANATLEWTPGCKGAEGRPLDTAEEFDALKAFCQARGVKLVPAFPGISGTLLRAPGEAIFNDGGKQVTLAVSLTEHPDGTISPTVTRRIGGQNVSRTSSQHLKADAWFVYLESASRAWIFDGKDELCVLVMNPDAWTLSDAADPATPVHPKGPPTEMLRALPDDVRTKYFHE